MLQSKYLVIAKQKKKHCIDIPNYVVTSQL